MIEGFLICFYAGLIYLEDWSPVLLPDLYPYIEKWFARTPSHNHQIETPILPTGSFSITNQGISSDSLWQHILIWIGDNRFFNWLNDQLKLPENKNTQVILNQNIVKAFSGVTIERSKIHRHTFSKVC
jgi:hypothetical protein